MKIVTDSANGASSGFLPEILTRLGAEVMATFRQPDGININKNCGSTHIEALQKAVAEAGADCGVATTEMQTAVFWWTKKDRSLTATIL